MLRILAGSWRFSAEMEDCSSLPIRNFTHLIFYVFCKTRNDKKSSQDRCGDPKQGQVALVGRHPSHKTASPLSVHPLQGCYNTSWGAAKLLAAASVRKSCASVGQNRGFLFGSCDTVSLG